MKVFYNKFFTGRLAILFALLVCGYWILANTVNVYSFKLSGALFEILWLPFLSLLILIPIFSVIGLVVLRFKNAIPYLLSIAMIAVTFVWLINLDR